MSDMLTGRPIWWGLDFGLEFGEMHILTFPACFEKLESVMGANLQTE